MRALGSSFAAAGATVGLLVLAACGWVAPARAQELVAQTALTGGGLSPWGAGCEWTLDGGHWYLGG
jgi:hypothetical protein